MALMPENTNTTAHGIHNMYAERVAKQENRGDLGWSQIGKSCDRALWLSFRWAGKRAIPGRIARLFDTGHREEARVIDDLRAIGCTVYAFDPDTGKQYGVSSLGGHFKGHLDLVAIGLPEAPKTYHLVDVKTIKTSKFNQLLKDGMEKMYPEYWAQAHGYIGHQQLERAMFIFVCKDDDRIHCERFNYDKAVFDKYTARAEKIIKAVEPPIGISTDPTYYECKFCDHHALCHGTAVPAPTCRSCAFATPELDGDARWSCSRHKADIPDAQQRLGCSSHLFIPVLLVRTASTVDASDTSVTYRTDLGNQFTNGDPAQHPEHLSSAEIYAVQDKAILGSVANDAFLMEMRTKFDGRLVA